MAGVGFDVFGDWKLNAAGTDVELAYGRAWTLQNIRNGASVFKGSWTYDRNAGVPYLDSIMVKGPGLGAVRTIFQEWLAKRPGVIAVESVRVRFDFVKREAFVDFTVRIDGGQILTDSIPFVLVTP